jgi:2-octaprenyl-6-methoxyphenol hydroxylase
MTAQCDIAIIGGGPVGAALALALRDSGLHCTLLESRGLEQAKPDPRALALSYGSRLLLDRLGVWQTLARITPIKSIHISQRDSFGRTLIKASDLHVPDLGYVLPYATLQASLHTAVTSSLVDFQLGASVSNIASGQHHSTISYIRDGKHCELSARLVVVADGGKLLEASHPPEIHDYKQSAIIAHVTCSRPASAVAFERFAPQGPLALLPYRNGYELVWTVPHTELDAMLLLDDATLLAKLHHQFGDRVGDFLSVGARSSFPLRFKRATATTLTRTVLIGNASQTLHPVAGQGFNLGLRDAWELAEEILRSDTDTLGAAAMLAKFRDSRFVDRQAGMRFTDGLVKLFSNNLPLVEGSRSASLSMLDCLPGMKKFIAKRMMFGANG